MSDTTVLTKGARGAEVQLLQQQLCQIGVPCVPDGAYEETTFEAVARFQMACNLEPSGTFDAESAAMLADLLATLAQKEPPLPVPGVAYMPAGAKGLNRDMDVGQWAEQLYQAGYRFALRSVSFPGQATHGNDLSAAEVEKIRKAGIALGLFQIPRSRNITPEQGTEDGAFAAQAAVSLGFPTGVGIPVWCDLEVSQHLFLDPQGHSVSVEHMISFLENWAVEVKKAGYAAGLYCGPQNLLKKQEISALQGFTTFWRAGANVYGPGKGYQLVQQFGKDVRPLGSAGPNVDNNFAAYDNLGNLPAFWIGEPKQ
jgi:hypothetical protein